MQMEIKERRGRGLRGVICAELSAERKGCLGTEPSIGRKSRNLIAKPEERAQFGKGRALRRCERDGSSHTGVDETDRTVRSIAQARRSRRGTTTTDERRLKKTSPLASFRYQVYARALLRVK
ncbi:hypothetical protein PVAP13_7KG160055 [Panicum virgatum]|uniref:Uncharacterized protein n=1 Tax=Panicum virgatum TaxID=38727 RepID=A0A8T0QBG9_PANVG|nr:hypothetical protein PVAP13_7KG160055 [Panicum virgatum]